MGACIETEKHREFGPFFEEWCFMGALPSLSFLAAVLVGASVLLAQENTPEGIIARVDQLYRRDTSYSKVEMTIVTPHWERWLDMEMWTEGMDKAFIYVTAPRKEAGMATLRIDREMWNYFPRIDKVMKVPPSMMMSSWMGSDFTNDDLVKESSMLEDYSAEFIESEGAEAGFHHIALTPREHTPSVWGRVEVVVRKEDLIPQRQVFFDEKGDEVRVMEFREVTRFGELNLPAVVEMVPLRKEGHRTVFRYVEARFDEVLDGGIFTLRNLRRKR